MLYSFYRNHAFDDIRIYSHGIAQKISATAIGDAFLQQRLFAQAAAQYAKVAASHPGSRIGDEARFKQGLSQFLSGDHGAATAIWDAMAGLGWDEDITLRRLEILYQEKRHERVAAAIGDLYAHANAEFRKRIVIQWMLFAGRLANRVRYSGESSDGLADYIGVHDRMFPGERLADRTMADALAAFWRYEEVLDRFPKERSARLIALAGLQRDDQLLLEFADDPEVVIETLTRMGRSAEIPNRLPGIEEPTYGLVVRGSIDRVVAAHPEDMWARLATGRCDEIFADPRAHSDFRRRAAVLANRIDQLTGNFLEHPLVLLSQGRTAYALDRYQNILPHAKLVRHAAGLEAAIAGDSARALSLLDVESFEVTQFNPFALSRAAVVPFIRELLGDADAVERSGVQIIAQRRYAYEQQLWYDASFIAGSIDQATFLAQPHGLCAPAHLLICQAVRAERNHHVVEALAHYRAYLALPLWRRDLDSDPVTDRFARWRITVLAAQ